MFLSKMNTRKSLNQESFNFQKQDKQRDLPMVTNLGYNQNLALDTNLATQEKEYQFYS